MAATMSAGDDDFFGHQLDSKLGLSIGELTTQSTSAIAGLDGLSSAFERLTARAIEAAETVGGFGQAAAGPAAEVTATARQFAALGTGLAAFQARGAGAAETLDRLAKSAQGSGQQARDLGADVGGARAEIDRFAKTGDKAGDEVTQVFKRAGEGIKRSFAQSFEDMIASGRFSFDRLASSVKSIFKKLAAELTTTLIIRPVLGGIVNAIGSGIGLNALVPGSAGAGGLGGASGGGISPMSLLPNPFSFGDGGVNFLGSPISNPLSGFFGGGASAFAAGGAGLEGLAGLGAIGGGLELGGAASLGVGSSLGGAGAGLAAAGPYALAAIAAVMVISSIFGKKKPSVGPYGEVSFGTTSTDTGHPAYNATAFDPRSLNLIGYGGDNGYGRDRALELGEGLRGSFNRTLRGLGGTLSDVRDVEIVHARQGKEGFTISGNGIASKTFQDYGAAEAYFVAQGLKSAIEKGALTLSGDPAVTANIAAALRNTTADSMEALARDLDFARGFKDQIDLMNAGLDPAATQLIRLRQAAEQTAKAAADAAESFLDKAKELFKAGTEARTRTVQGSTYATGQAALDAGAITLSTERIHQGQGEYTERTTYRVQGLSDAFDTLDQALARLHTTTVSVTDTVDVNGTQIEDARAAVKNDALAKLGLRRRAAGGFEYVPEDQRTRPLHGLDLALEAARTSINAWEPTLKQLGFTAEEARAAVDAARAATEAKTRADWASAEFVRRRNVEVGLKSKLDPDFQARGGDLLAGMGLDPRNFASLRDQINATMAGFKGGKDDIAAIQAFYDGLIANQVRDGKLTADQAAALTNAMADQSKAKLQNWTSALQAATKEIDEQSKALEQQKSTWEKLGQSMKATREGLLLDKNLSPLSVGDRYDEIRRRYDEAVALAQSGDIAAIEELPSLTRTLLETAKENFGATERYYADFQRAQAALQSTETLAQRQVTLAEQQLAKLDEVKKALDRAGGNNPDRNFGAFPTRNRILAQLTGYAGDFGGGRFQAHLATLPQTLRDMANSIAQTVNFAEGGVMTPWGPLALRRYGLGGIANGPQVALFGEGRLPEAFVPLPDGRSIPVTLREGAGANDNAGLVAELRALRAEVAQLRAERARDHGEAQATRARSARALGDLAGPVKAGARK